METLDDRLHDLQAHQDRLLFRRLTAERKLRQTAAHPSVVRYLRAEQICEANNLSKEWAAFSKWFESQTHNHNAPISANFFLYSPEARILGIRFDPIKDREAIKLFVEARDAATRVRLEEEQAAADIRQLKNTR